MNVPLEKKLDILVKTADNDVIELCAAYEKELLTLAKGASVKVGADIVKPQGAATGANEYCEVFLPLEGIIDVKTELERLNKELGKVNKDFEKTSAKLNNENFTAKAPAEVIEKEKEKLAEFQSHLEKLQRNIELLKNMQ